MQVAIVSYGIGNVQSVANACRRLGAEPYTVSNGSDLSALAPSHIILPGVGAIGQALANLRERGFEMVLRELVIQGQTRFFGICVGMQVLGETCEEFGVFSGLGWIPGNVCRLSTGDKKLPLPHVGWNSLDVRLKSDPIFAGADGQDVYFVHSCAMKCPDDFIAATTDYGTPFVSAIRRNLIVGAQFHPEKSAALGDRMIAAFLAS